MNKLFSYLLNYTNLGIGGLIPSIKLHCDTRVIENIPWVPTALMIFEEFIWLCEIGPLASFILLVKRLRLREEKGWNYDSDWKDLEGSVLQPAIIPYMLEYWHLSQIEMNALGWLLCFTQWIFNTLVPHLGMATEHWDEMASTTK